jgi:hypothetical protein
MKTLFLLLFLTLSSFSVFSQTLKFEKDTISYGSYKVFVGKEVQLFYGSSPKKEFIFVSIGSALAGVTPLESVWSKRMVKIDKVYKTMGKVYARGIILDAPGLRALGGNKVFIDVEGAIDNKELKTD